MPYFLSSPVLWRRPGETQVGIARPLILSGLTARDQHLLALMEGPGISALTGLSPAGLRAFDALLEAGVVHEGGAAVADPALRPSVAIHGLGAPGAALAECLARLGFPLELCDDTPLTRESRADLPGPRGSRTCASAAADAVRRAVPGAVVRLAQSTPALAVVFGVGACDPTVTTPLMATDTPHLLITTDEAGAWAGPLVVPGQGPCATCVGLHAADADALWPQLSIQLGNGRRPRLSADAVAGVVAVASAAALAHVEPARDAAWIQYSRWRVQSGAPPEQSAVTAHPACGCGAPTPSSVVAPTDELAVRRTRLAPPPAATRRRT